MKKGLVFVAFLTLISNVSASCFDYAGQNISMKIFLNECAWYLSIPLIIIGLLGTLWPNIPSRINYFTTKNLWGKRWKEEWGDQKAVAEHVTEYPFGKLGIRIVGILFLVVGLIILVLQIVY